MADDTTSGANAVESLGAVINREAVGPAPVDPAPAADGAGGKDAAPVQGAATNGAGGAGEGAAPAFDGAKQTATAAEGDEDAAAAGAGAAATPKAGTFYKDGRELPGNFVPETRYEQVRRELGEAQRELAQLRGTGGAAALAGEHPPEGQEPWKDQLMPDPDEADFEGDNKGGLPAYMKAVAKVAAHNDRIAAAGLARWREEQAKGPAPSAEQKAEEERQFARYRNESLPRTLETLGITAAEYDAQFNNLEAVRMDNAKVPLLWAFVLNEPEEPAAFLYHLAGAPVEYLQRVADMEPRKMMAELARMDARMAAGMPLDGSKPGDGAAGKGTGAGAAGTAPVKVAGGTKAASPPPTSKGGGVATGGDVWEKDGEDFFTAREAMEKEKRRRK